MVEIVRFCLAPCLFLKKKKIIVFYLTANTHPYWPNRNISGKMYFHQRMLFCHNINIWKALKFLFIFFLLENTIQNSKFVAKKKNQPCSAASAVVLFCLSFFLDHSLPILGWGGMKGKWGFLYQHIKIVWCPTSISSSGIES